MAATTMYNGLKTGAGTAVPVNPTTGQVNLNALMNAMVSRDIWSYYDTLKIAPATTYSSSYQLFNYIPGQVDPYAITAGQVKTRVETNMPSPASNGFSSPRDLIMDQLGFYFLPGGCGLANSGPGTFANIADMQSFCQHSYFEFKIIDKTFIEGFLELNPPGVGFTGVSTAQTQIRLYPRHRQSACGQPTGRQLCKVPGSPVAVVADDLPASPIWAGRCGSNFLDPSGRR